VNPERSQRADACDGVPERWNPTTRAIIGCAIEVHRTLGRGLPEKHYEEAVCIEFARSGIAFRRQVNVRAFYKDMPLPELRLDLLVEDCVIVELKALDKIPDAALAQLVGYLRAARMPVGLLINFNVPILKDGVYRRLNDSAPSPLMPVANPPARAFESSPISVPSVLSVYKSA
jgi:GxxExxY protein